MNDRIQDKLADERTDRFLRDCVADGRMSQAEYDELRLDHYSADTRPAWVSLPIELGDELRKRVGLSLTDVEVYLNSETMTQLEIAVYLRVGRQRIRESLARVYAALPELRGWAGSNRAVPALRKMRAFHNNTDDIRYKF